MEAMVLVMVLGRRLPVEVEEQVQVLLVVLEREAPGVALENKK